MLSEFVDDIKYLNALGGIDFFWVIHFEFSKTVMQNMFLPSYFFNIEKDIFQIFFSM